MSKKHHERANDESEVVVEEVKREKRDDRNNAEAAEENANSENQVNEKAAETSADEKACESCSDREKVAELEKKLAESEKKAEEYKASWYRTAADFDNFRKRNSETRMNAYADGKGDVIKKILVIGDNLDRALNSAVEEKTREGLELVIKQYDEVLKNLGVETVDPVGETFDPNLHEAVHQVEAAEGDESGKIKQVFKKGYSLNGKMLRYAQVIVVK